MCKCPVVEKSTACVKISESPRASVISLHASYLKSLKLLAPCFAHSRHGLKFHIWMWEAKVSLTMQPYLFPPQKCLSWRARKQELPLHLCCGGSNQNKESCFLSQRSFFIIYMAGILPPLRTVGNILGVVWRRCGHRQRLESQENLRIVPFVHY